MKTTDKKLWTIEDLARDVYKRIVECHGSEIILIEGKYHGVKSDVAITFWEYGEYGNGVHCFGEAFLMDREMNERKNTVYRFEFQRGKAFAGMLERKELPEAYIEGREIGRCVRLEKKVAA